MTKTTYREKLADPRWQKVRLEKLDSTDFACESCGATDKTLHVHHKQYFKSFEPWQYELEELATLCGDCHESEHALDERFKKLIASANIDGPGCKEDIYWLIAGFIGGSPDGMKCHGHQNLYEIGSDASGTYWKAKDGTN
jgi:hypothetical protein